MCCGLIYGLLPIFMDYYPYLWTTTHSYGLLPIVMDYSLFRPEGRLGSSDVSPCLESQGCHLIPSFYLLPCYSAFSPVAHSIFSLFLLLAQSPVYFKKKSKLFFSRDRLFCIALVCSCFLNDWEMISWSMVSVACYLMALILAIYAFRHVSFLISR